MQNSIFQPKDPRFAERVAQSFALQGAMQFARLAAQVIGVGAGRER